MSSPIIDIHDAVVRHPQWRMAAPVNFQLLDGEQVAIVGRNGAGKSLLVDIMTGAHPIMTSGDGAYVRYDFGKGRSTMVSDNIRTITFRDAYSTAEGYYYYQLRYNQGELAEGQDVYLLSSGELRRHQLRKAMEGNPRVLIVDNPFIGLDAEGRGMVDEMLARLAEDGVSVVVVTSRRDELPSCITHVVEVKDRVVGPSRPRPHSQPLQTLSPALPLYGEGDEAIVEFRDVTIRYGERTILNRLTWTIHRGEHWALKGRNGSGKSTLLSLICADNPQAYANDISLFGRRRGSGESIWDIKRHIGYVSPEMHRAFLRPYPAIDIVASGLYDTIGLYRRPRAEDMDRCERWMQRLGISHLRDRSFLTLSGGEQRLMLLARAFVKDPDLLILDEPLHGLDEVNSQMVKDLIDDYMSDQSRTLIMVSHYDKEFPKCIEHEIRL